MSDCNHSVHHCVLQKTIEMSDCNHSVHHCVSQGTIEMSDCNHTVHHCVSQGTIEMLLAGAVCGFGYALFAGQPLTIIGATGPLLVFESILFQICK